MHDIQSMGQVDATGLRAVQGIVGDGFCRSARYEASKASTNAWAMADLQQTGFHYGTLPRLYLTDSQTAGRGRMGRTWVSNETTLTFSIVVSCAGMAETSHLLPLAIGVGIARAIEYSFAPFRAALKWPNDVYLGGSKVAGILVETTQTAADARVIGIGINVGRSPDLSDQANAPSVTSIGSSIGRPIQRYVFLRPVVCSVLETVDELGHSGESIVSEFRDRCLLSGHPVRLSIGVREQTGICQGVSEDGELLIRTDEGTKRFSSGEASFIRLSSQRH